MFAFVRCVDNNNGVSFFFETDLRTFDVEYRGPERNNAFGRSYLGNLIKEKYISDIVRVDVNPYDFSVNGVFLVTKNGIDLTAKDLSLSEDKKQKLINEVLTSFAAVAGSDKFVAQGRNPELNASFLEDKIVAAKAQQRGADMNKVKDSGGIER